MKSKLDLSDNGQVTQKGSTNGSQLYLKNAPSLDHSFGEEKKKTKKIASNMKSMHQPDLLARKNSIRTNNFSKTKNYNPAYLSKKNSVVMSSLQQQTLKKSVISDFQLSKVKENSRKDIDSVSFNPQSPSQDSEVKRLIDISEQSSNLFIFYFYLF